MIYNQKLYRTYAVSGSTARTGLLLAGLILVTTGCATGGMDAGDGDALTDAHEAAVPAPEPRSRYGNPDSYVVFGRRYHVKDTSDGHVEKGMASWYGPGFHGRRTSSGERYDMHAMTAAHKHLPLPSYVEVVNLQNGRSAVVKVNDRGPFKDGRVIDLSYAAAKKLGVVSRGTAMVELRAIDPTRPGPAPETALLADAAQPKLAEPLVAAVEAASALAEEPAVTARTEPAPLKVAGSGGGADLYVQVGAFGDRTNAEQLRARLVRQLEEQVQVRTAGGGKAPLYKVHVGPLRSPTEARDVSRQLASLGVTGSRVVAD